MTTRITEDLMKIAEELPKVQEALEVQETLTKIAFAKKTLDVIDSQSTMNKTAAPLNIGNLGTAMGGALVAGVGLGLAGEIIDTGHKKIKKVLFERKIDKLTKEVKKNSPELQHTDNEDIKKMLRAGYTLAPDLIQDPTIAASLVGVGQSLGGKLDPNTIKTFADAQGKSHGRNNRLTDALSPGVSTVNLTS